MLSSTRKNKAGKEEGVLEHDSAQVVRNVLAKKTLMEGPGISEGASQVDI